MRAEQGNEYPFRVNIDSGTCAPDAWTGYACQQDLSVGGSAIPTIVVHMAAGEETHTLSEDELQIIADKVNKIEQIKRNGTALQVTSKAVDIAVPTKTSELTNDSQFQTKDDVVELLGSTTKITMSVVDELPESGVDATIYLVPSESAEQNVYSEYLFVQGAWEKIGDTASALDLAEYVKGTDLVAITADEIEQITATV